ncbi:hypothetical protein [Actinoplanes sp. HUAS TT8]|uniref:hypothetical protein n=1 Tax=Actinoplanes sp. HUAS TT8 TaxID=3447453 RepID=UPI003F525F0D
MDARRRPAAVLLIAGLLLAVAACSGDGAPQGLPSDRPSVERTVDRTTQPTPTDDETTRTSKPDPTPTEDETTKTSQPEPTRTRETRTVEPTKEPAKEPTKTQATAEEPVAAATTSTSAAVVPASEDGGGGLGAWGWLLLIGLFTGLVALLMANRSGKVAGWDAEARGLAGETRTVLGVRLPPILTTAAAAQRGLAWPPVRDDLTSLEARWAALLETTPDGERQAYASQVAGILRDLVNAVDAENEALAAGRDWRLLRPRLDAIVAALAAALEPAAPVAAPVAAVDPGETFDQYGDPVDPYPDDSDPNPFRPA